MPSTISAIRHAIVCAAGSGGDVLPFVHIGRALARRGIGTTLLAPGRYRGLAESASIAFESAGADDVFADVFDNGDVWHPTRGLHASWRYFGAAMRASLPRIRAASPANTVLIGSSFAMATRLAEELDGFRSLTVHLSPAVLWSAHAPARWPNGMSVPRRWPLPLRRWIMDLAERASIDPTIAAQVNPYRKELGLRPARRFFSQQLHGARLAYAFPEWFAGAAPDWPTQGRFAGFVLPPAETGTLAHPLTQFLARPKPLVVITAGTAVAKPPRWMHRAREAALALGCKVVLVSRDPALLNREDVLAVAYAPFPALLSHARVAIHHGGIGTMAECMRAGVAQIVVPAAHDQPDNAERLAALGIGVALDPAASAKMLCDAIRACLQDADIGRNVGRVRERIVLQPDAAETIADLALGRAAAAG